MRHLLNFRICQTIAVTEFLNNILFIFQRLNWLGIIDILLVTLIFFGVLYLVRRYAGHGFAARHNRNPGAGGPGDQPG